MRTLLVPTLLGLLAGCGITDDSGNESIGIPTLAEISDIRFENAEKGVTPFIYRVRLTGKNLPKTTVISYVIEPKPGSTSNPVRVTWTQSALSKRGKLITTELLELPVFGLYADYANQVSISLGFADNSTQTIDLTLTTDAYIDPTGIYDAPVFVKSRTPGRELGFDFFAMKSNAGTPVIVDTDGALRWVGTGIDSSFSSVFADNAFIIGDQASTMTYRLELDGSFTSIPLNSAKYWRFHHNIDPGRSGFLGEFDTFTELESAIAEFDDAGNIVKEWDFGAILSQYMASGGDDPGLFVRPGIDWFHLNAATYDSRDDSLVVSSRENFVIKVDYDTGEIIWILGDPTKYWWTFPSLRAKALTLDGAGLYPIGQHALSVTSDGLLLMFNNGLESIRQPAGAPVGESRTYSAVSAYRIDENARSATEEWRFDYDKSIYSFICSGAYEAGGRSLLINYSWTDGGIHTRFVGLDANHEVVFDFQYENAGGCNTSFNALPIPLEDMNYT